MAIITIKPGSCSVLFCTAGSVLVSEDLGWYLDRVSLAFYLLEDLTLNTVYKRIIIFLLKRFYSAIYGGGGGWGGMPFREGRGYILNANNLAPLSISIVFWFKTDNFKF